MARINLSNGSNSYWFTADEADAALSYADYNGISFEVIASMMDEDTSARVAFDVGPCSDDEFLAAYLKRAEEDLIIG